MRLPASEFDSNPYPSEHAARSNPLSSIDVETEALIKKVIEEEFKDYTVITIAHRLKSILGSDRVAVLEAGELLEFDSPTALLSRESRFKALYDTYAME